LVAVMIMVSIGTFSWDSIAKLREHPPSSSLVIIATVVVTVSTHDLAKGVFVGVLLSGIFFAHKVGKVMRIDCSLVAEGSVSTYCIAGQVFFASTEVFIAAFDFKEVVEKVGILLRCRYLFYYGIDGQWAAGTEQMTHCVRLLPR
jgi:SulP family sulfate permease